MGCGGSTPVQEDSKQKVEQGEKKEGIAISQQAFISLNTGAIKDDYVIGKKLGEGAFGVVRRVQHKVTKEDRAMKTINMSTINKEEEDNMMKEINILKQLDHPHIIKMYEFYKDPKNYYIVTELVEGGELFDKLQEIGEFQEKDAATILKQLMSVINYAHSFGIVHRDLKPENVLLEKKKDQFYIKVIDWGTAAIYDPKKPLTELIGTPYYIAPEILKPDRHYDNKCDVWSAGVILYILLSGEPPFDGKEDPEILENIQKTKHSYTSEVWKSVSSEVKNLIDQMLVHDPKKRLTAQQVLQHKWLQIAEKDQLSKQSLKSLNQISKFNNNSKFQQAVLTFIASQLISKDEAEELGKIFKALDANGDGTVNKNELLEAYKKQVGDEEAEKMCNEIMSTIDADNSGVINYSEFLTAAMDKKKAVQDDKLKKAFDMFDRDSNGVITEDELNYFLQKDKNKKQADLWRQVISQVDKNGDGKIQFDEFKEMMHEFVKAK